MKVEVLVTENEKSIGFYFECPVDNKQYSAFQYFSEGCSKKDAKDLIKKASIKRIAWNYFCKNNKENTDYNKFLEKQTKIEQDLNISFYKKRMLDTL